MQRHTHTHTHTHTPPAASVRWSTTSITLQRQGAHQVSWKVLRVNSNGSYRHSCRHSSVETFKEETLPLYTFFSKRLDLQTVNKALLMPFALKLHQTPTHMLVILSTWTSNKSSFYISCAFHHFLHFPLQHLTAATSAQTPASTRWLPPLPTSSRGLCEDLILLWCKWAVCITGPD